MIDQPLSLGSRQDPPKLPVDTTILLNLVQRFGHRYSKNQMTDAVLASAKTAPIDRASDALKSLGFLCRIGVVKPSDLSADLIPAILIGRDGSLALFDRLSAGQVYLYQSVTKKATKFSSADLKKWFSGQILFARPDTEDQKSIKNRLRALSPLRTLGLVGFLWVAVAAFLSNVLGVSTSLFVMVVYDRVLPNQAVDSLYALAIGVGIAILFDQILKAARSGIVDRASVHADGTVTEELFEQFVEMANTKDRKSVGELASVMRDFEIYREFMSAAMILTLVDLPFVFVFVYVIYLVAGPLFIVPLICIPTVLILVLAVQPILARNSRAVSSSSQSRQGLLVEVLGGLEALRVNGAFAFMKRKFIAESNVHTRATTRAKTNAQFNTNAIMVVQQVAQVVIIVYGFHLFVDQVITMGAIIAVVILSGRAMAPLAKVAQTIGRANSAYVAFGNLKRFLTASRVATDSSAVIVSNPTEADVQLHNITTRLSDLGPPLFNGLNLSIKSKEKLAIVGMTGAGKTSLLKVILGLLTPETGSVSLCGADIRQYSRADLVRTVGTVFQDPWLFSGTLRDNVAMGQQDIGDDMVLRCLTAAGARFVTVGGEAGLDMHIEERGNNLSGGQKQAVMLARAMVFRPKVYLLDEPTSAMDRQMEDSVLDTLTTQLTDRTLVIVTHKPSLVAICDRVLVLSEGRIVGDRSVKAYFRAIQEAEKIHGKKR